MVQIPNPLIVDQGQTDDETIASLTPTELIVGDVNGTGTFILEQTASLTDSGDAVIGADPNSTGTWQFNPNPGDTASSTVDGTVFVGAAGSGELDVAGGVFNAAALDVGEQLDSSGIVNQTGGTVNDSAIIGDAGTGTYNNTDGTDNVTGELILGNQSTGNGTYTITGDSAVTAVTFTDLGPNPLVNYDSGQGPVTPPNGALIVGLAGTGSFIQGDPLNSDPNNQVNVAGDLVLGEQANSIGTYTLNDGILTVGGKAVIGGISTGANLFTQAGGTVNITGSATSDPNYVGDGSGDTNELLIGGSPGIDGGTGTYAMTGGTATVGSFVDGRGNLILGVGAGSGSIGNLNLSSSDPQAPATLTVYGDLDSGQDTGTTGNVVIGTPGAGGDPTNLSVLRDTNGVGGDMTVGDAGDGNLTVHSGTLDIDANLNVGVNGTGTVTQEDGSTVTAGFLDLSIAAGSGSSSYTVNGGVLGVADLNIGGLSTGTASFIQSGGQVNVQDDHFGLNLNNSNNTTTTGTANSYLLNSGTLDVFNTLQIGAGQILAGDPALFLQLGGSVTLGSDTTNSDVALNNAPALEIGQLAGDSGQYVVSPGLLAASVQIDGNANIGDAGTGQFQQEGGTLLTVTVTGALTIANQFQSSADYSLAGGSLDAGSVVVGNVGAGTFEHSLGTLTTFNLILGSAGTVPNSSGVYTLTAKGMLDVTGTATVGGFGNGLFNQGGEGGTSTATFGTLVIGDGVIVTGDPQLIQREGTYNLFVGTLNAGTIIVGNQGLGFFNQSGGAVTASAGLILGNQATAQVDIGHGETAGGASNGSYNLSGGTLTVDANETIGNAGIGTFNQSGDSSNVVTGTLAIGATGEYDFSGGTLSAGSILDLGKLVASGANTIDGNISGSGTLELAVGAVLTVHDTIDSAVGIVFDAGAGTETLDVAHQVTTLGTIDGFVAGDTIRLLDRNFTSADHFNYVGNAGDPTSGGVLTITDASSHVLATLDFTGSYTTSDFQVQGTEITICFYPGTNVRTPSGEAAVETLEVGDLVMTHDGRVEPIRWIGRQTVSRVFADPLRVLPIRIRAGALGHDVPCRDLLVSPDHALLVDGVLIQAGALVNGTSIAREHDVPTTYSYYHIELDDHSLILAENVPAETFIDNADRLAFDNWQEHQALYPDGKPMVELPYPRAKAHRQVPRAVRRKLATRGVALYAGATDAVA